MYNPLSELSTLIPIKSELDQIAQGLETCDILSLMKKHPNKFKELFLYSSDDKLSLELMLSIFDIMYSEEGSSCREIKERTIQHWNEFLIDIGNGSISCTHTHTHTQPLPIALY